MMSVLTDVRGLVFGLVILGLVIWALAGPKVPKPDMYKQEPP
jgi:hypothetical protein